MQFCSEVASEVAAEQIVPTKMGEGLRRISNSGKFFIRAAAEGNILFLFLF